MKQYKKIEDGKGSFIDRLIHTEDFKPFYHYALNESGFKERNDVARNGLESQLGDVIQSYIGDDISDAQQNNIEALKSGHQVVVGGQQAGLFVSPLYTIHKIISIIVMAKEQSIKLNKLVIPVFWIAGEDHDFDEVNHANVYDENSIIHRVKYYSKQEVTDSVSNVQIDRDAYMTALNKMFTLLGETEHTKVIYQKLRDIPGYWTEHFKSILQTLFKSHGVLFIDSQYKPLRALERHILKWQFEHHEAIDAAFRNGQNAFEQLTSERQIITDTNVHLFLQYDGMRQLLKFDGNKYILPKSGVALSKEEVLAMIEHEPERISNNVVTRPLMQESVFNTLAFIGGPSEIKYWGELTQVFEYAQIKMPLVVPRMRITYMTQELEKIITRYDISLEGLFANGIDEYVDTFLKTKENYMVEQEIRTIETQLEASYESLIQSGDSALAHIAKSNVAHHKVQFDYMLKAYRKEIKRKYTTELKHFTKIKNELNPDGLQERVMHPVQIMNRYGIHIFDDVLNAFDQYQYEHIILLSN